MPQQRIEPGAPRPPVPVGTDKAGLAVQRAEAEAALSNIQEAEAGQRRSVLAAVAAVRDVGRCAEALSRLRQALEDAKANMAGIDIALRQFGNPDPTFRALAHKCCERVFAARILVAELPAVLAQVERDQAELVALAKSALAAAGLDIGPVIEYLRQCDPETTWLDDASTLLAEQEN